MLICVHHYHFCHHYCHMTYDLCNSCGITYTLVGRKPWVIREQTHEWCHSGHFECLAGAHLLWKQQRKNIFLHLTIIYKRNQFHFSVPFFCTDAQKMSKCGENNTQALDCILCILFWSHNILASSVHLYKSTEARKNGIYFLIIIIIIIFYYDNHYCYYHNHHFYHHYQYYCVLFRYLHLVPLIKQSVSGIQEQHLLKPVC